MPADLQVMYDRLVTELKKIAMSEEDILVRSERSIMLSKRVLQQVKSWILEHPFSLEEDEIFFFKNIKPRFYAQLLFHRHLYLLTVEQPEGGRKVIRKYLKKKLRVLEYAFEESRELYHYLRRGDTNLDKTYFLRGEPVREVLVEVLNPDADPDFSTLQDHKVAEIFKNELLLEYLQEAVEELSASKESKSSGGRVSHLQWTGTLSAMYELVYAFRRAGVINNGKVTISELAEFFSANWHVNLKSIYIGHQENRVRKERAAFLKTLVKKLEEDMDEADENPRC